MKDLGEIQKNPGNPNKNYEIREILIKNRELQIINIKFVKSESVFSFFS
jgi:hypothetical protein